MKKLRPVVFFAALLFVFSSCSKYEEGPSFSLATKTSRLTGTWELVAVDDEAINSSNYSFEMVINKDGTCEEITTILSVSNTVKAEWEWHDGKEEIRFIYDNYINEVEILRLTNDELWFENDDNHQLEFSKK